MQILQFEASWDKALARKDREKIKELFHETKYKNSSRILFTPIREAINHKEELLVSVLVHNFMDHPLHFEETKLSYNVQEELLAVHSFTLPALVIPSKVSMPWTFIFPKGSFSSQNPVENGRLILI